MLRGKDVGRFQPCVRPPNHRGGPHDGEDIVERQRALVHKSREYDLRTEIVDGSVGAGEHCRGQNGPQPRACLAQRTKWVVLVRVFGDLETVVMAQLWAADGQGTVREVVDQLRADREVAYTTVLSTMENLYRKGHLRREREGKAFRYRTTLSHTEHIAGLMREALSDGEEDTTAVLMHFVEEMSPEELAGLEDVIRRRSRRATKR